MVSVRTVLFAITSALLLAGCYYGDLSVHGKKCSNRAGSQRPCPPGYVCVESPTPPQGGLEGICYESSSAPACPVGRTFCTKDENRGIDWVEKCQSDGHSSTMETNCKDFDNPPLTCNPDTGLCAQACPEGEKDCPAGQTCDMGTWLCRPFEPCDADCAPDPTKEAVTSDPTSLDCFGIVTDPGPQTQCTLTGLVYFFPMKRSVETGLLVTLRPNGDPDTALGTSTVYQYRCNTNPNPEDPCGYYQFNGIDTNRTYDLEISQPAQGYSGDPIVTTVHAGITVRTDRLENGSIYRSLNAMTSDTYASYTASLIENYDTRRGLLFGRVLDCGESDGEDRRAIGNATVGLAADPVPPGRMLYFPDKLVLAPDPTLSATTVKGYYAAVGVPACRNQVGFSAREVSELFLGAVHFTMRPGYAIFIDNPHPKDMPYP